MNLVTGGTGLIGSWLLLELSKRGKPLRVLKRKESDTAFVKDLFLEFLSIDHFEKIEWVEGDVLDLPSLDYAFAGVETLYQAAAFVSFNPKDRKQIYKTNVVGTENVVNTALAHKVKNLICFSSISTLDADENSKLINENALWNPEIPHSWYAISKKRTEMEFYRAGEEAVVNLLIVNPGVVIGSLDGNRSSESLFKRAFKNKAYVGSGQTSFVDVRDVARFTAELVEREVWNNKFILSAGEARFSEVFNLLRKEQKLGKCTVLSDATLGFVKKLSVLGGLFGGQVIDKAAYNALTGSAVYSTEKIKAQSGLSFIPVEEALRFHAGRYLKNKNSKKK